MRVIYNAPRQLGERSYIPCRYDHGRRRLHLRLGVHLCRRAAVQQHGARKERRVDQLPFPKFTVGATSAPALAWNGVIGLAP